MTAKRRGIRSSYLGGRVLYRDDTASDLIPDLIDRVDARSRRITPVMTRDGRRCSTRHRRTRPSYDSASCWSRISSCSRRRAEPRSCGPCVTEGWLCEHHTVTEMGTDAELGDLLRCAWRKLGRCEHFNHQWADECLSCEKKGSSFAFGRMLDGGFTGWRGPFCSVACYRKWEAEA